MSGAVLAQTPLLAVVGIQPSRVGVPAAVHSKQLACAGAEIAHVA
jgi:hypothetical protein